MKRYYIESLGCAKNQVDSEQLMFLLSGGNWESVGPEDADIIIVNSCGFIESAKQESINTVLAFRKRFPLKKIMLAGCLAVRYAQDLSKSLVEADVIFPSADIQKIVEYLFKEGEEGKKDPDAACAQSGIESEALPPTKNSPRPLRSASQPLLISGERPLLSLPGSAYIKIAEGCNNSCSFCAIPLIRGSLRSRTIPGIQSEFEALLKRGVKEINLIAQDSASYGRDSGESLLAPLLESLLKTSGNFW
ncbi:MAG: 30S ribosomal protein S12 methylthiotransferase RimO, partial [Spirochaetaceae bacterium]|nr:30S ribosomal protein S12 methylthiotransferase RimO [Spirochaetaceae bacterium]